MVGKAKSGKVGKSKARGKAGKAAIAPARRAKKKKAAVAEVSTGKKKAEVVPAKGALVARIPGASQVLFTANGTGVLVVRQERKTLTLWDLASGMETPSLKALPTVSAVGLSADNRLIAMGTSSGILAVDSTQAGKVAWKTKASGVAIGQVLFTLDGGLVIAAGAYKEEGEGWFDVFQAGTGEVERGFEAVAGACVCHLALSPDGLFLAHSEVRSDSVLVWHLPTRQTGACVRLERGHGRIVGLAFGNSVKELYVAQENRITAWNGENGMAGAEMAVEGVRSVAVIDGGRMVASLRSGAAGSAINLWGAERGRLWKTLALPTGEYGALAAPPGGVSSDN